MGNDEIKYAETGKIHHQEVKTRAWTTCTIQDLLVKGEAEVKTGPFGTQLHARDYVEQGTPVINARNIGFGDIRPDKLEFISEETVQRLSSHLLEPDDIVFGRKGTVERHAFIRKEHARWFQGTDCLRLRLKSPTIDPRFVSYCFLIEAHKSWIINQSSHGSTMTSLNQGIIGRILLRLPPLSVQNKIVAILSAYDDLIENNTRRIKILEEMAQALYREWFVNFRFPGHEKVKIEKSTLGKIPDGWIVANLSDLVDFIRGVEPGSRSYLNQYSEDTVQFLRVGDLGSRDSKIFIPLNLSNDKLLDKTDIALTLDGTVGIVKFGLSGCYSTGIRKVVILDREKLVWSFLYCLLKSEHIQEIIKAHARGTTIIHAGSAIEEMKFVLPPIYILDNFENNVSVLLKNMLNLQDKNANLRRTRDLLLPKLISGEVDVEKIDVRMAQ